MALTVQFLQDPPLKPLKPLENNIVDSFPAEPAFPGVRCLAGWKRTSTNNEHQTNGFMKTIALPQRLCPPVHNGHDRGSAADPGRRPPGRAVEAVEALFPSQTVPKNDREKKILAVLDEMDQNQRRGSMSVPVNDGRLLRILAESTGAKHVVELGTSIGYSGLWFCLALENTGGKLTTFEIDEGRAATARENFKRASETGETGLVTLTSF
jgi:hypothetical protein